MDSIFVEISEQIVPVVESEGVYTASYVLMGTEPSGNIGYVLNYQDLAGNQGIELDSTQDSSYVKHDLIPPEIIKCYISSDNSDSKSLRIFFTFELCFFAKEKTDCDLPPIFKIPLYFKILGNIFTKSS